MIGSTSPQNENNFLLIFLYFLLNVYKLMVGRKFSLCWLLSCFLVAFTRAKTVASLSDDSMWSVTQKGKSSSLVTFCLKVEQRIKWTWKSSHHWGKTHLNKPWSALYESAELENWNLICFDHWVNLGITTLGLTPTMQTPTFAFAYLVALVWKCH